MENLNLTSLHFKFSICYSKNFMREISISGQPAVFSVQSTAYPNRAEPHRRIMSLS